MEWRRIVVSSVGRILLPSLCHGRILLSFRLEDTVFVAVGGYWPNDWNVGECTGLSNEGRLLSVVDSRNRELALQGRDTAVLGRKDIVSVIAY